MHGGRGHACARVRWRMFCQPRPIRSSRRARTAAGALLGSAVTPVSGLALRGKFAPCCPFPCSWWTPTSSCCLPSAPCITWYVAFSPLDLSSSCYALKLFKNQLPDSQQPENIV